jgi:hypothetical protein
MGNQVRFINTLDGFQAENESIGEHLDYFESLQYKQNLIYLVYEKSSHLLTNDIALAWEFVTLLFNSSNNNDVTIKVFDKSDTDEVMILASKIHNVDLIPIQVMKN